MLRANRELFNSRTLVTILRAVDVGIALRLPHTTRGAALEVLRSFLRVLFVSHMSLCDGTACVRLYCSSRT
jgi:hypothetical protein